MQDRVQLKREEVVGDGVALSDINPITNTKSVEDGNTGESLEVTIERIWAAINNALSRIVNSVNGRDGVVVITADDVGLGNVTNVSFSTIKDWVIDEILNEFNLKRFHLFNTYAEFLDTTSDWTHDKTRANTPFFIKVGKEITPNDPNGDERSQIGYFYWDDTNEILTFDMKPINVIQQADNSIIYNENVGDKLYADLGKIGVNIWSGEDALKIYNNSAKNMSGLYIDKTKIAPDVFFFNGVFGNGNEADPNALVYEPGVGSVPPDAKRLNISINGSAIGTGLYTLRTFKINDIIVTNFSDENCRIADGTLKQYIDSALVNREACIGAITSITTLQNVTTYNIDFYTIKPYVGMGLKYYDSHTSESTTASFIGIDLIKGKSIPYGTTDDNISGLNAYNNLDTANVQIESTKEFHTVTPVGDKVTTEDNSSSSLFVSPDFSLNVIPYNSFSDPSIGIIRNWPTQTPTASTGLTNQSFLGVNLLKRIIPLEYSAYNMSGLRIVKDTDTVSNATLGKSDNDDSDKLSSDIAPGDQSRYISGGLAVNVGKFLEIGSYVGDDKTPRLRNDYYDGGKINVRINDMFFDDTDNRLALKLSKYENFACRDSNAELGGGLTYTPGYHYALDLDVTPGLAVNRGLGLRMSHYDRFGETPPDYVYTLLTEIPTVWDPTEYYKIVDFEYVPGEVGDVWAENTWYSRAVNDIDKGFLAVSVIDKMYTSEDIGSDIDTHHDTDARQRGYGGLRYMIGDVDTNCLSSIGLRVNDSTDTYGHELRLGSKAIGIDENNVVQVQRYRETDDVTVDTNPLVIKGWDEAAIYPYVKIKGLGMYDDSIYDEPEDLPVTPNKTCIYFVKSTNRHYVWSEISNRYEEMFITDNSERPVTGEWNRIYVETDVDNVNHTFVGNAYKWEEEFHIHLPFSWNGSQYVDSGDYKLDSLSASKILAYYAAQSVRKKEYNGYYNPSDKQFYRVYNPSTHEYNNPMTGVEGQLYFDVMTRYPEPVYKFTNGEWVPVIKEKVDEDPVTHEPIYASVTHEDLVACDLNNDGVIDAYDSTLAMKFYAWNSTRPTPDPDLDQKTPLELLKYYLETFAGITDIDTPEYVLVHGTDPNGSFMPGLDININNNQGVTTELNGDIKNSVSVKIFDSSAGDSYVITGEDNTTKTDEEAELALFQGGLRFTTKGYLAVRVNDTRLYDATTPDGRLGTDQCRNKLNKGAEPQENGARGLRIYGNNVLGVQLGYDGTLDNGQLAFDEFGSLVISPNYQGGGGGGEYLTITDGTTTVQYNGSEAMNITLGPGLILEPDPEPEPEPNTEPSSDNEEPGE